MNAIRTSLLACAAWVASWSACAAPIDADSSATNTYFNFLYQYMPQPDQTDYDRAFYEHNIRLAIQARTEMPWGSTVPEREFRHFVLPVRVNNEYLDNSRAVFYEELKPRVATLSMKEAILEVNHWCHEKVTYRPTDARTSSPLACVKTAYGRCGEESTFLVAALRAVGIPARQVYTPRWAHTDDNHAWVEAWADGRWWFLGACEPEPVLNLGWFNESASRGMLMNTRVFGEYDGPEEVMSRSHYFTEINVTDTYAPTTHIDIVVTDAEGKPVSDALVEFKLYNYAEFFTMALKRTDAQGRTSLSAGRGDMLVWVSKNGVYAFRKVSFTEAQTVCIALPSTEMPTAALRSDLDLTPPQPGTALPHITQEQREANDRRKAEEDSIRAAYERTMPREEWRGNYEVIQDFLATQADTARALRLLQVLTPKDLMDITREVLNDNTELGGETPGTVDGGHPSIPDDIYYPYVLSPRVELEQLVPYKRFFRSELQRFIGRPAEEFANWCLGYVHIDDSHNPTRLRMSPISVYRHRTSDRLSRNIFFVSAARSIGIPARINEINGKLQYWDGDWIDAEKDGKKPAGETPETGTGSVVLTFSPTRFIDNPQYYTHFTISRIVGGRMQLLNYPEQATWQNTFAEGQQLDAGRYVLTTGIRLANGGVLAHTEFFDIKEGEQTTVQLFMRENANAIQVIGSLDVEDTYVPLQSSEGTFVPEPPASLLSTVGRNYYVLGLIAPNEEPTNHALRDIAACADELEQWGRKLVLLFASEADAHRFNLSEHRHLPATVTWGIDNEGTIRNELAKLLNTQPTQLNKPIFVIADSFNRVVFVQQGYTIGLGNQIIEVKRKL